MGPRCRIRMLGSLRVQQGDREITRFRSERTAALLAYLAYHLGESHPREVLAETIWPGQTPRAGRNSLNTALSSLRRQLEPPSVQRGTVIQSDPFAVQLDPETVTADVREFEAALRCARDADSIATRVQHLRDAVALYAGELLRGFYDEWVVTEQRKLEDQYFEAALELSALLGRTGDPEGAIAATREAITRDPLREEAHCELIRLYAASGEPVVALRHYAELKDLLARELGQEPSPATAQLVRAVRAAPPEVTAPRPARRPTTTDQRSELQAGMVTFLLTDIEGATALSESMGQRFEEALATYHSLLGREFRRHGAQDVREAGASCVASFRTAADAVECAVAGQSVLAAHSWPQHVGPLRVRMALYTGDVLLPGSEALDGVLKRASRVLAAAHGGQVLCGEATATLLKRDRRQDIDLTHLGTYRLRDVPTPEKLFQVSHSDAQAVEFPALRAEAGYADNLPLQLTRFFGRERELAELRALLTEDEQRLVTLTGPGGSGKTRLALEVAREALGDFDGAVWFVPLVDLRDAKLVSGAVADALGLQRSPHMDPLDQVASFLSEQPSLLILDNLEQFGPAAGPVVLSLLDRSRSTTCLATSRRPLGLPGEQLYLVPPLPTPDAAAPAEELLGYASVRLFIDRAQAARPDFQLAPSNAETIAALCERLDGIPLAIELAAARAQAMTTSQMLAHLERPFELLVSRRRVTDERHKALEAAIDWSYQLLPEELQRFFLSLSVFRGGCACEAAAAVCEEPRAAEYLEELAASSLVIAEEANDVMRFRLLETLREFGRERLPDADRERLKVRHASWFFGLAQRLGPGCWAPGAVDRLDCLESDHDNLRAALDWCASEEGDTELGVSLACTLAPSWAARGHTAEMVACLLRALGGLDAKDDTALGMEGEALGRTVEFVSLHGDHKLAIALLERQLQIWQEMGHKLMVGGAHGALGGIALCRGNYDEARTRCTQALALAREREEDDRLGIPVGRYGELYYDLGRGRADEMYTHYKEAFALGRAQGGSGIEEAPAARRGLGVSGLVACALVGVANTDIQQGHYDDGEPLIEEALHRLRQIGLPVHEANVMRLLASVQRLRGNWQRSRRLLHEALRISREFGNPWGISNCLDELGRLAVERGDCRVAREHLEEALRVHRQVGRRLGEPETINLLGRVALAAANPALARQLHEQALDMARGMELRPQVAASLDGFAAAAAYQGRPAEALQYRREALELWHEMGTPREIAENLEAVAGLMATPGRAEVGAVLLAAAEVLRKTIGAPVPPAQRRALRETGSTLRKLLEPSKYAAARERGRQLTLDEAVQLALEAE